VFSTTQWLHSQREERHCCATDERCAHLQAGVHNGCTTAAADQATSLMMSPLPSLSLVRCLYLVLLLISASDAILQMNNIKCFCCCCCCCCYCCYVLGSSKLNAAGAAVRYLCSAVEHYCCTAQWWQLSPCSNAPGPYCYSVCCC
jgi:hypothetical protein